ncbi:hypothetical protein HNR42_000836 [Deinobacterium chartae]|uniref:Uncharacterized protein n=1 Tax=Deinobacterium chartae TaxID=521158 RepID=A0A841HYX3_9DEIO|nr:hypothetical protein [Deinobacterium chartae]MBB6097419.1 hypothetical protein [Deinobacterium chartae]
MSRTLNAVLRFLLNLLLLAALFTGGLWVAEALRSSGVVGKPPDSGSSVRFTSEPDNVQVCVGLGRDCRN